MGDGINGINKHLNGNYIWHFLKKILPCTFWYVKRDKDHAKDFCLVPIIHTLHKTILVNNQAKIWNQ